MASGPLPETSLITRWLGDARRQNCSLLGTTYRHIYALGYRQGRVTHPSGYASILRSLLAKQQNV